MIDKLLSSKMRAAVNKFNKRVDEFAELIRAKNLSVTHITEKVTYKEFRSFVESLILKRQLTKEDEINNLVIDVCNRLSTDDDIITGIYLDKMLTLKEIRKMK